MRIKDELFQRNSNKEFSKAITARVDSCTGIIHVRANEVQRAVMACRKIALQEGSAYYEWDIVRGITEYNSQDFHQHTKPPTYAGTQQLHEAMRKILVDEFPKLTGMTKLVYLTFVDPSAFWQAPAVVQHMRVAADLLPMSNIRFIIITPDEPAPEHLGELMSVVKLKPPGFQELLDGATELFKQSSDVTVTGRDDESMKTLCFAAAGMTMSTFEDALSLGISANHVKGKVTIDSLIEDVSKAKTEIVNKNDILELYRKEDMQNVGGMENLKEWINFRKDCYSDEAEAFGIEPPKGMVFVGPPGTGKSLAAKAVASELKVPLVRLDFGRVFNSLVGSSEERIRKALAMVEFMAPVVLFADEIDKGLGGIGGGGGDSGTSSRVLGTFLTWLQECEAPVFTMVTANNISHLPPELMRRGRFDAIFSTGMPTAEERLAILKIHMKKRGWEPGDYRPSELNKVVTASRGYVGAEIESAVKDGLILAFNAGENFTPDHITEALKVMVPLSKSYNEQILLMTLWAKQNATPASKVYEEVEDAKVTKLEGRRVRAKKEE